jgi:hypothetical protein
MRVLAAHDYDPLTDSVVGWKLQPGESIRQSFRLPEGSMRVTGFRVRLRRNGMPSPLHYQLRAELGGAVFASGVIPLQNTNPWFERWYGADFAKPVSAPAHRKYYLELRLPKSPGPDYVEVFGSAEQNIADQRFLPRFRYVNTWGEKAAAATEFENSANLDYGVRTRGYAEGMAYADGKSVLDGFDLAFEILGDGPAGTGARDGACGACEERFAFTDDITGDLFGDVSRDPSARNEAGEVELDGSWSIENLSADQQSAQIASVEFRDFLKAIGVRSARPNSARKIRVGTKSELPAHGAGLSKPESFRLKISAAGIDVCGYDARGAMRGLHHLEAIMRLRRAPILPILDDVFAPAHLPRITSTPFYAKMEFQAAVDAYTDGLLARISRAGFNAIWVWGDLDEIAHSSVYPELDADEASVHFYLGVGNVGSDGHAGNLGCRGDIRDGGRLSRFQHVLCIGEYFKHYAFVDINVLAFANQEEGRRRPEENCCACCHHARAEAFAFTGLLLHRVAQRYVISVARSYLVN